MSTQPLHLVITTMYFFIFIFFPSRYLLVHGLEPSQATKFYLASHLPEKKTPVSKV